MPVRISEELKLVGWKKLCGDIDCSDGLHFFYRQRNNAVCIPVHFVAYPCAMPCYIMLKYWTLNQFSSNWRST